RARDLHRLLRQVVFGWFRDCFRRLTRHDGRMGTEADEDEGKQQAAGVASRQAIDTPLDRGAH
ncbi:MAG TPA: hypothetical protein VH701_00545, partial [Vicinamibacterales bacterium]